MIEKKIQNNQAVIGGGLFVEGSRVEIDFCTISHNKAVSGGGGLYIRDVAALSLLANSIFSFFNCLTILVLIEHRHNIEQYCTNWKWSHVCK